MKKGGKSMYDVIIIGGGVVGCGIARELAKQDRKIALLERAADVCEGTSKANSGIIHAGYDATPGTLKASLNVQGNQMMETLAKELDIPFKRNGSFVLMFEEEGRSELQNLYDRGQKNGVKDLQILSGDEARVIEPNLSQNVKAALYAPSAGIVCPFGMTYAFAENAAVNGVEFYLDTEVTDIKKTGDIFTISTLKGEFKASFVINAAGVYGDKIHNMVSDKKVKITPYTKQDVDNILRRYNITLENNQGYDYVYIANMCKADFLGDSIPNEQYLAKYIKNVIDDPDGYDGLVFYRWYADVCKKGIVIDWEDVI